MQPDNASAPPQEASARLLQVPSIFGTKRDVLGLLIILETYIEQLVQRDATHSTESLSVPGEIAELCSVNGIETLDVKIAEHLKTLLQEVAEHSPVIRLAFSTEPDDVSMLKLVEWFRREITPNCLLQVSIQPSIAGGCIVRTGSRIYDFSFRHMLLLNQPKLMEVIKG